MYKKSKIAVNKLKINIFVKKQYCAIVALDTYWCLALGHLRLDGKPYA